MALPEHSWLKPVEEGFAPVVRVLVQEADTEAGRLLVRFRTLDDEYPAEVSLGPAHAASVEAAGALLAHWTQRRLDVPLEATLHAVDVAAGTLAPAPDRPDRLPSFISLLPCYMVNVSALTHFDFCPRNYLMDRYTVPGLHPSQIRGNLVHEVFEPLLREPDDRESWHRRFGASLRKQVPQMLMAGTEPAEVFADSRHHLNTLFRGVNWLHRNVEIDEIFVERFFLDPELGLKGKIDALVRKKNGRWQAFELKTGKSWGRKANRGHAYQVSAYQLMLMRMGFAELDPPCVIYTGDGALRYRNEEPPLPPQTTLKPVPFGPGEVHEHINLRNQLVRIDITGALDFNDNDRKCQACIRLQKADRCLDLHHIGLEGGENPAPSLRERVEQTPFTGPEQDLFRRFNEALLHEFRTLRCEHGRTLLAPLAERVARGRCAAVEGAGAEDGGRLLRLRFPEGNTTEIREGDPCLLSDAGGVLGASVLEVWVASIDREGVRVRLPRGVQTPWFKPAFLDSNSPETAFARNFAGLFQLWHEDERVRENLAPVLRHLLGEDSDWAPNQPRGVADEDAVLGGVSLLPDQRHALACARGLGKLLLVQGPPGTGKTFTLACLVRQLFVSGRRVLVATYTHRAAEEVMAKLERVAPEVPVRKLGRRDATSSRFGDRCLDELWHEGEPAPTGDSETIVADASEHAARVKERLAEPCVYVGTVQTWISGSHDRLLPPTPEGFPFDVAVVDEAGQIITPAMLGVLRLAPRWILVGDHQQLPPVVVAEAAQALKLTLFESLAGVLTGSDDLLVSLGVQHRMPPDLGDFISCGFYGENLASAPACQEHRLPGARGTLFAETSGSVTLLHRPAGRNGNPDRQFPAEATAIIERLAAALDEGLDLRDAAGRPTVGIIAPYRRQVAFLRRLAEERLAAWADGPFWEQVIDTVDRFQGDEREWILMSLCLDPAGTAIPRIYQDARRLNVALSRARARLCVVGDLQAMEVVPLLRRLRKAFGEGA